MYQPSTYKCHICSSFPTKYINIGKMLIAIFEVTNVNKYCGSWLQTLPAKICILHQCCWQNLNSSALMFVIKYLFLKETLRFGTSYQSLSLNLQSFILQIHERPLTRFCRDPKKQSNIGQFKVVNTMTNSTLAAY